MKKFILPATVLAALALCVGVAFAASSPTVTTSSATSIGNTSAVLNGSVNPNGAHTTYAFKYGTTPMYGSVTPSVSVGSGTKSMTAKQTVSGLVPGTTYYYQLVAINTSGTGAGVGRSMTTTGNPPPGATTEPATDVNQTGATLNGIVSPQGAATTWYFNYGTSSNYEASSLGGTIPAGSAPVAVANTITGLTAGTTFHYRLVAIHGTSFLGIGLDATFETFPSPRPIPHVTGSTAPRISLSAPYDVITTGHIQGPASTPGTLDCVGTARVTISLGRKVLRRSTVPVQPSCTFAASAGFGRRLPGKGPKGRAVKLTVRIHFNGNDYLAPAKATPATIILK